MKVLTLITRGDSIGGAQTHVLTISKKLISNGHDVLVVYGGEGEPYSTLLQADGIDYRVLKCLKRAISPLDDFKAICEVRKIIKAYNPDIVTLHSSKAGIIGRLCRLFINKPTIVTIHGWAFTDGVSKFKAFFYRIIERFLGPLADKIIVVSEFDRQLGVKYNITKNECFARIYNGISITHDPIHRKNESKLVNLIMVARFDDQKDHITLINACKDIPNIKIHLLGDGPKLIQIKEYVKKLRVEDKVFFWGYTKEVNKALEMADIFLLISNWEGFPISTLEAMNHQLPVIVSNVGGAGEAIKNGFNGFVIPKGDANILKEKLMCLINDESLRLAMGSNSRQFLIDHFSEDKMYEETYSLYESINRELK